MSKREELGLDLTPKQRAFVEYYLETKGNAPEAAMMAYNCGSRNCARVIAHRNLHNPKILNYLDALMLRHDAADRVLAILLDAAKATMVRNGKELPDHSLRLKVAQEIAKLGGFYPR